MKPHEFYDKLATADINADEAVLKELAVSTAAPPLVRFYAAHKAAAIKSRKAGLVLEARRNEDEADLFYIRMPKRYRW